ncbi:MAG: hypothetical protein ACKVWR_04925 [Acidimicrobiales bacterium]
MPVTIDTPLLVVGPGPGALVVAKVAGGWGLPTLLVGHRSLGREEPVELSADAIAVLTPHGVLEVMRPYLAAQSPPMIAPAVFEEGLKHHCVVDMNVTVYDGMDLVDAQPEGEGVTGVLTDGKIRWPLRAEVFVDAAGLPSELSAAIVAGGAVADRVLAARRERAR